jgi:hypothetical protein
VRAQNVGSVFGMGGAYLDGTLAVAVFFTDEKSLDSPFADRFASLISTFKMATSKLLADGRIYRASSAPWPTARSFSRPVPGATTSRPAPVHDLGGPSSPSVNDTPFASGPSNAVTARNNATTAVMPPSATA